MPKKGKKASATKKKANAYDKPPPIPQGEVIQDDSNRKWEIGPSIGVGGFGEIYSAWEYKEDDTKPKDESSYPYVVKIEPIDNGPLFVEMHFYQRNCKQEYIQTFMESRNLLQLGMPAYHGSGSHNFQGTQLRFLVLERYGKDISKMFTEVGRQFPAATVFQLGLQMLDVLDYIHGRSYIHADLKGANILLGVKEGEQNQAFLLDFGLAFRIVEDNYRPKPINAHEGTLEFTSRDRHIGAQTMRGDLEILAYNMLQWLVGALPWESVQEPEKVHKMKLDFMTNVRAKINDGFPHVPDELIQFFEYVNSLDLPDKPNYPRCREIFEGYLKKAGKTRNSKFEFTNINDNQPSVSDSTDLPLNENGDCAIKKHTDINIKNVVDSITNLHVSSSEITSPEEAVLQRAKRTRNPPKRYTSESGSESETAKTSKSQKIRTNDKNVFVNPTPTQEKKNVVKSLIDKQNESKQNVTKSKKTKASSSNLVIEAETDLQVEVTENNTNVRRKNEPEISSLIDLSAEKPLVTKDNGKKFKHKPLLETNDVVEVPVKQGKAINSKNSKFIETISLIENNSVNTVTDDNQKNSLANNNEVIEDNCSGIVSQPENYEEDEQADEHRSKKTKKKKKIRKEINKISPTETPVDNEVELQIDDHEEPETGKQKTKKNRDINAEVPTLNKNNNISKNKKNNKKRSKKHEVESMQEVEENLNELPEISLSTSSKDTEDCNLIQENKKDKNHKSKKTKQTKIEVTLPLPDDNSVSEVSSTNREYKKVDKKNKMKRDILKDPKNSHPTEDSYDDDNNHSLTKNSKGKALSDTDSKLNDTNDDYNLIKTKKKKDKKQESEEKPVCKLQENTQEEIITKNKRKKQKKHSKTETMQPEESDHDQSQDKRQEKETNRKSKQKKSQTVITVNEDQNDHYDGGIVTNSETTEKKKKAKNPDEDTSVETNVASEEPNLSKKTKKKKKNKADAYSSEQNDNHEVHTELSNDSVEQLATKNSKRKLSDEKVKKSESQPTETDNADFKSDDNLEHTHTNKKRNKKNKKKLVIDNSNLNNVDYKSEDEHILTNKKKNKKHKEKLALENNIDFKSDDDVEYIPSKKKRNKKNKEKPESENTNEDYKSDDNPEHIPTKKKRNKKDKEKSASDDIHNSENLDIEKSVEIKKRKSSEFSTPNENDKNTESDTEDEFLIEKKKRKINEKNKRNYSESNLREYSSSSPRRSIRNFGMEKLSYKNCTITRKHRSRKGKS